MPPAQRDYIPALRFGWLTPVYDLTMHLTMRDPFFKLQLLKQADTPSDADVLDLGCGTATLSILAKQQNPLARVSAVDIDSKILDIACRKTALADVDIDFHKASVGELPFPDASFDRVLSCLVFHHLDRDTKLAALEQSYRVLKPGGEIHIADWGPPTGPLMRIAYLSLQLLDGFATTTDNAKGIIPQLMKGAGFIDARQTKHINTCFGTMALYSGTKSAQERG